jgi:hypothetical protein
MKAVTITLAVILYCAGPAEELMAASPEPSSDGPVKVEIVGKDGKYQLLRSGKPYIIRGAGIGSAKLETFASHGGNSFRTWTVDSRNNATMQLLDRAHAQGLTVSLCLEVGRERQGFDYDDEQAVARQLEELRVKVLAHKDHPALLAWIIGNELNYDYTNSRVYDAVNDISRMIREVDPNHPTTTAIAGAGENVIRDITERASDLDFISFQLYGGLVDLPRHIENSGYTGPYFVTEWGSKGHWEVAKTNWGAPIEHTSSEKADNYANGYRTVLEPHMDQGIGNYVFLWGQKQERTPTWYGMFLESGESTEAVDVMHHIWNGQWPANRAPRVGPVNLDNRVAYDNVTLEAGMDYPASIKVEDPEQDPLSFRWELRHESTATEVGGDHEEIPDLVPGMIADPTQPKITLTAPAVSGAYRLFVYVFDGNNHAAHANIPFYVQ